MVGTSTTGIGDLQDDWDDFSLVLPEWISPEKAAIRTRRQRFLLTSFAESMKAVQDELSDKAEIVGRVPDEGIPTTSHRRNRRFVGRLPSMRITSMI